MAIKFTPEYNKRINKVVDDYNRKVRRSKSEGKINKNKLPELASVKTLKKSYNRRSDLDRELKNLEAFKRKDVRSVSDGVNEYQIKLINANRDVAIKYFEHQADIIRAKAKSNYPLQKDRLNAIEENLKILKKGTDGASGEDLLAMSRYIDKYRQSFERQATGYRGFLSEVDLIMEHLDIPQSKRDEFFSKLSKLNSEEFMELYEREDIISRIYELADSPKLTGGELQLKRNEKEARELIDSLLENIDVMIADVKSK